MALEPREKRFWLNRGTALENSGRIPEALENYREALALDPQYAMALKALARLEQR